ncbi:unnamed protein product, partial [Nesidiocoris tenuis]
MEASSQFGQLSLERNDRGNAASALSNSTAIRDPLSLVDVKAYVADMADSLECCQVNRHFRNQCTYSRYSNHIVLLAIRHYGGGIEDMSDDDRMSLTTAVSDDDDGESVHASPYRAKQTGTAAASFNCTGAVRKAGTPPLLGPQGDEGLFNRIVHSGIGPVNVPKVCLSRGKRQISSAHEFDEDDPCVATILAASPAALAKAVVPARIGGVQAHCLIDTDLFLLFGTPAYVHSDRGASFLSKEVTTFLHNRGTATSHSTPYHPHGNGQIEKFNCTIWRAVCLNLKTKGLSTSQWETVLGDSLHSIRSLLCTATNATPHERMFMHQRRSTNGCALPTWLVSPGTVLLRKHVRASKYDPAVEQVELVEANPHYALVRFADGRESNVALQDLAPAGDLSLFNQPETSDIENEPSDPGPPPSQQSTARP